MSGYRPRPAGNKGGGLAVKVSQALRRLDMDLPMPYAPAGGHSVTARGIMVSRDSFGAVAERATVEISWDGHGAEQKVKDAYATLTTFLATRYEITSSAGPRLVAELDKWTARIQVRVPPEVEPSVGDLTSFYNGRHMLTVGDEVETKAPYSLPETGELLALHNDNGEVRAQVRIVRRTGPVDLWMDAKRVTPKGK